MDLLLPLQPLLYSAFATSVKLIYRLRLTLGCAGIVLLLGRHLPSSFSPSYSFQLFSNTFLLFSVAAAAAAEQGSPPAAIVQL